MRGVYIVLVMVVWMVKNTHNVFYSKHGIYSDILNVRGVVCPRVCAHVCLCARACKCVKLCQ